MTRSTSKPITIPANNNADESMGQLPALRRTTAVNDD
jgi:hypothetical protein